MDARERAYDPRIHLLREKRFLRSGWIAGSSPAMTAVRFSFSMTVRPPGRNTAFAALYVPFRGAPEVLNEVMAGRLDFYMAPAAPALPLIVGGKLKALAGWATQSHPPMSGGRAMDRSFNPTPNIRLIRRQ
jgi:hypothetical protein